MTAVLALVLVALGWTPEARADGGAVALVVPNDADELLAEAATRLRAELVAAGFEVRELRAEEGTEPDAQTASQSPAPVATIAIVATDGIASADIWVVDRATRRTVVRHVDVSNVTRKRAPSVLAVRSVELLRASLMQPGPEPEPKPEPGPAKKTEPTPPLPKAAGEPAQKRDRRAEASPGEREPRRPRFGGELGAAALYGPGGVSAAFAPLLRVEYGTAIWAARLGLVLPALGAEAKGSGGSASVRQELAALDVAATWPAEGRVAVVGSAGGGAYHWHIEGHADAPNVGHDADRWGFAANVGLGVMVRTGARSGFLFDTQTIWMAPAIAIEIAGVTAARSSQPTLCTSLGFRVAL